MAVDVQVGAGAMEMWETSGDHERMAAMSIAMAAMHLSRGEVKQAVERLESSLLQSRKYVSTLLALPPL
jgi:Tfp pilus assembly protein PilF